MGHDAKTVQQAGWSGLTNGELLRRARDAGFEVFVTADQGLPYQQTLEHSGIGVVVLAAKTNRFEDLEPLVPNLLKVLPSLRPGEVETVA